MLRISRISRLIGRNEGLKGARGRDGLRRRGKQGKMSQANSLTLNDGHDSALLNSRRTLEAIGIDTCIRCQFCLPAGFFTDLLRAVHWVAGYIILTSKELGLQGHLIEGVDSLIIVGLDLGLLDVLKSLVSHDCGLESIRLLEFQALLRIQEVKKSEIGSGVEMELTCVDNLLGKSKSNEREKNGN